jgi:hypothetical protein
MSLGNFARSGSSVVASILILFGLTKFANSGRPLRSDAAVDVLLVRLPEMGRKAFWPALGLIEVLLGSWLFISSGRLAPLLGSALFVAMTAYLVWARIYHPGKSCGCGGASREGVSVKTITRAAVLLLLASAGAVEAGRPTVGTPIRGWMALVPTIALEAAVIALLSMRSARWDRVRLTLSNLRESFGIRRLSNADVRRVVEGTEIWKDVVASCDASSVVPTLLDSWRKGSWQVLEYSIKWCGSEAIAIAASHLAAEPPWIKVAILRTGARHSRGEVMASWDSFAYLTGPPVDLGDELELSGGAI